MLLEVATILVATFPQQMYAIDRGGVPANSRYIIDSIKLKFPFSTRRRNT